MLKKILMIVVLIILTTGCNFRYEIDITNNKVTEKRTFLINNNEVENNDVKETIRKKISKYSINDDMMIAPSTKIIKEETMSGYQTIMSSNLSEYKNSDILSACYTSYNVISENSKIYLTTGRQFTCFKDFNELQEVEIILSTNHKVLEHNADEVKGSKYIWYINKQNSQNKPINIELEQKSEKKEPKENEKLKKIKIVFITIVAIFPIIVIIMLAIRRKQIEN